MNEELKAMAITSQQRLALLQREIEGQKQVNMECAKLTQDEISKLRAELFAERAEKDKIATEVCL